MNVLIDHHHYELALSLSLLFRRFGFTTYIPSQQIVKELGMYGHGFSSFNMQKKYTSVDVKRYDGSQNIDLCISSVPHNYPIFKKICKKTIQQIGNHEWTLLDFDYVLTSDLFSYRRFKDKGNKTCYYYPEIDLNKYKPEYKENRNIHSYIVNIEQPYGYTFCKACGVPHVTEYPTYSIFTECKVKLQAENINLSHDKIEHMEMHNAINNSRLTWHFKPVEGYGFSAISSLLCGVPIIINPKWLAGTTLMTLCLPFKTALYCNYTTDDIFSSCLRFINCTDHETIKNRCRKIVRSIVDFEYEADKVKRFIECVI